MKRRTKITLSVLGFFVTLLPALWLASERVRYAASAAVDHLRLMASRVPVRSLMDAPDTSPELREKLRTVLRARRFASEELGLPNNDSYRHYIEVGRPEIGWNVFAAPEFSIEPLKWCFPVAGCVAYRGYSSEADARAFAADMAHQGNDVYVARFTAYSTLGWFEDSLLSTFMNRPAEDVAGIIFHELAHQRLYVAGDSDFSEAFAVTVGREALRRWLRAEDEAETLKRVRAAWECADKKARLMLRARDALADLYASSLSIVKKRAEKEAIVRELRQSLRAADNDCEGAESSSSKRERQPINNASLAAIATYSDLTPAFEKLLADSDGDFPEFYERAAAIANLPPEERTAQLVAAGMSTED